MTSAQRLRVGFVCLKPNVVQRTRKHLRTHTHTHTHTPFSSTLFLHSQSSGKFWQAHVNIYAHTHPHTDTHTHLFPPHFFFTVSQAQLLQLRAAALALEVPNDKYIITRRGPQHVESKERTEINECNDFNSNDDACSFGTCSRSRTL
jgi:hypothetical protein